MTKHSISKLFLGTGVILLAGSLTMCKKDSRSCKIAPEQASSGKEKKGVLVKSTDGKFTDEQTYELIRAFKAQAGKSSRSESWTGDVALDLAEYELEASINFDFDSYGGADMLDVHQDVSTYPFNIDPANVSISSTELNDIYDELRARLNAMISSTVKISAIDVATYIDDASTGQGHFEVTASVMQTNSATGLYKCTTTVWSPGGTYANCSWAEINSVFSCGGFNFPGNVTGVRAQFQIEMNCRDLGYIGCDNGYYFTGVSTVTETAYSGSPRLYYGPTINSLFYCNASGATTLSGAAFNNMLANAKSFVLNDCSNSFLDLVDNSTVINRYGFSIPQTALGIMYWDMNFQKGTRRCKPHIDG